MSVTVAGDLAAASCRAVMEEWARGEDSAKAKLERSEKNV